MLERSRHKLPERVVLEEGGPFHIGERGGIRGGGAVLVRYGHRWPLVIGPDGTTGQ
jgi:hypothetical protein